MGEDIEKIGVVEFERELARMCLRTSQGFPTKRRHQHILYRSVTSSLDEGRAYSEAELNQHLVSWLGTIGRAIEIDHVGLRRNLVDHGYLARDAAGVAYRVDARATAARFEPAVSRIDPQAVLTEAAEQREQRKRQHLEQGGRSEGH